MSTKDLNGKSKMFIAANRQTNLKSEIYFLKNNFQILSTFFKVTEGKNVSEMYRTSTLNERLWRQVGVIGVGSAIHNVHIKFLTLFYYENSFCRFRFSFIIWKYIACMINDNYRIRNFHPLQPRLM